MNIGMAFERRFWDSWLDRGHLGAMFIVSPFLFFWFSFPFIHSISSLPVDVSKHGRSCLEKQEAEEMSVVCKNYFT